MGRHKITERSFVFEMPDGSELVGYPLTIAHHREFLRDGTFAVIEHPSDKSADEVYAAAIRYVAAALRKPESAVVGWSPEIVGQMAAAVIKESIPQAEGDVGPGAKSP